QTDSAWAPANDSTDWFDPLNWSNGIPNTAGDTASVATDDTVTLELGSQAALGQLNLLGHGDITLQGDGPLFFDNPGENPAVILATLVPRRSLDVQIATPVFIAPGESLVADIHTAKNVALSGSIAS